MTVLVNMKRKDIKRLENFINERSKHIDAIEDKIVSIELEQEKLQKEKDELIKKWNDTINDIDNAYNIIVLLKKRIEKLKEV